MEIRTYPFFWFLSTTFVSNTTGPFFRFGLIGMVRIRGWLGGNSSDSRQDAQSTPNYWLPVTSPVQLFYRQERALPNNSGTIAKDIADLCWVMGIGDGRFKICQARVPSAGHEYTGIQGSDAAETFGFVWSGNPSDLVKAAQYMAGQPCC